MQFSDDEFEAGLKVTLSPEDAVIVDALLGAHEAVASSPRRQRVQGWLAVLGSATAPQGSADLVERTVARVQRDRMTVNALAPSSETTVVTSSMRYPRFRLLRELAAMAVAASVLGAVITVGIAQARQSAHRVACASNLRLFANAFAAYASAGHDELPALPPPADRNWLRPNPALADSHTNADNLRPLMNASLIRPVNFICPGRAGSEWGGGDGARGYSYANLFGSDQPEWDHTHGTIILADRNPLFDAAGRGGGMLNPQLNSVNHGGRGSYVLRADGSVVWETSPDVGIGRDNIWTIGAGPQYRTVFVGMETPASEKDTFLSP